MKMRPDVAFVREPKDRSLPGTIFISEKKPFHRPVVRFRLQLDSREDVLIARRSGVPVYLLEPWVVEALGYPLSFRPRLLVSKSDSCALMSNFIKIEFLDVQSVMRPHIEDVVVAMLKIDPIGARRLVRENLARVDTGRLLKRILQEDVEPLASRVRLQDYVPDLPIVGRCLNKGEIRRADQKLYSEGIDL